LRPVLQSAKHASGRDLVRYGHVRAGDNVETTPPAPTYR
jgi:hypothetical protein